MDDEIQEILAELRESGDYFRDEDFDIMDREQMDECFIEKTGLKAGKGVYSVYKRYNLGETSKRSFGLSDFH